MIDVYSWATPNGHKVHIMLEETGLEYNVHGVNIGAATSSAPSFSRSVPNNKIPAIVDSEGPKGADGQPIRLFESGAILIYLAEKTGKFLPTDPAARYSSAAMADVPDGRRRPDARSDAPLPHLRAGDRSSTRSTATRTRRSVCTA